MDEKFVNKEGTDNHVGEKDEMGLEILQVQKEKYEEEMAAYEEAVENYEKNIANYSEQWEVDKALMQKQLDHFGMIPEKVTHKIHLDPEYWELEKKKYGFRVRQETFQAEQYLKKQEQEMENAKKRIEIIKEELAKVLEQMGDD